MIQNKKILILGMARSGVAAAKLLIKYHNDIILTDIAKQDDKVVYELTNLGINVIIQKNQEDLLDESFDLVIKNPAISNKNNTVVKARRLNIPVINEIEASYKFLPENVKIIAITGSNGKTTTTTITYELLKRTNYNVHFGGNMGIPLASFVEKIQSGDLLVLEISNFQLADMYEFKTDISVITNLSQVHIDFHETYDNYKQIKKRIFNNHTKDSIAILNAADKDVISLTKDIPSKKLYFSSKIKADAYLKNNKIIYNNEEIIDCSEIKIKGNHNYENIMIGIIIAKQFGIQNSAIKEFLKEFGGVEHRIEYVKTLNKRKFYNDSKATNNKSTNIALDSFKSPIILLMGGLDRNIPFDEIGDHLHNVKAIISYGQTKDKIFAFARKNNIDCHVVSDLKIATEKAYEISEENDIILLSPACASWDQFKSFEERGKYFKDIVNKLK